MRRAVGLQVNSHHVLYNTLKQFTYLPFTLARQIRLKFHDLCVCTILHDPWLLVGFVALRPKSTAMVIAGRSVHTFSWAGLNERLTSNLCTYFRL